MRTAPVTEKEIAFLSTFGYLHLPGYLDNRIDRIMEEHDRIWAGQGNGHYGTHHDFKRRSICSPFIDRSEYLCTLLDDPRLDAVYSGYLGDDYNYMGSGSHWTTRGIGWHSDGSHPFLKHIKLHLYLDNLTAQTGAVRVIPGSHRVGEGYADEISKKVGDSEEIWGKHGSELPCIAVENRPGDVIVFDSRTKHASFFGGACRRFMSINASERFPDDKLDDLQTYIEGTARFWNDRVYGEIMINTATPERMVHLEQVMANDGHIKAIAAQNRLEMAEPSR